MLVARAVIVLPAVAVLLAAPGTSSAHGETSTRVPVPEVRPVHGQSATLAATVTNVDEPAVTPTGKVQFFLDDARLGQPVSLVDGVAPVRTPPLAAGRHAVRAEYLTDPRSPSSGTAIFTVARAPTATTVRVGPSNGVSGQDLDVEATVVSTTPPFGVPSGPVTATVDGAPAGVDALDPNGAVRWSGGLPAAAHTIRIHYDGDEGYAPSSGSAAVTVAKAGTVIVLASSPNPAVVGQRVTFDVSVASLAPSRWWPSGMLTGWVDGQPVPGSVTLTGDGDGASFEAIFGWPGRHRAAAHFSGDQDFRPTDTTLDVLVTGPRPAARALSLEVTPSRDRRAPYRFTVTGRLRVPGTVPKAVGCAGAVTVVGKMGDARIARKTTAVTSGCTYKTTFSSSREGTVAITAAFAGNASVAGVDAKAAKV